LNTKRYGHTEKQGNKKDQDETHRKTMRQIKEVQTEIEMQRIINTKRQRLTHKQRDKVRNKQKQRDRDKERKENRKTKHKVRDIHN